MMLIVAVAGYVGALLWSHLAVIGPRFAYRGFEFNPASAGALTLAVMLAIAPTLWMPLDNPRPSVLTYVILYFLLYIPACIVPICTLDYHALQYIPFLFSIAAGFGSLNFIYRLKLMQVRGLRVSGPTFWTVLFVTTCVINLLIIRHFGLNFRLPSLRGEIYDVRFEYKAALAGSGLIYLIILQSKVLAPLFVIWGVHARKLGFLALGVGSQLFIFANAGIKTVLFSSLFIVGLYFALRLGRRKLFLSTATFLIAVVGVARIADKLWDADEIYFSSIFVRRLILTPGLLSGYYVDFFSQNPKAMYGHSVLEGIVDYPYGESPARLISSTYFGSEEGRSNANLWADGFANLGLPGVAIATVSLALVMWCYDSVSVGVDPRVSTLLLAMPSLALVNSALSTVLVSHGLLLAMALVYIMPKKISPLSEQRRSASQIARSERAAALGLASN